MLLFCLKLWITEFNQLIKPLSCPWIVMLTSHEVAVAFSLQSSVYPWVTVNICIQFEEHPSEYRDERWQIQGHSNLDLSPKNTYSEIKIKTILTFSHNHESKFKTSQNQNDHFESECLTSNSYMISWNNEFNFNIRHVIMESGYFYKI